MNSSNLDAPNVKIIPPLVYLAGLILGSVVNVWIPTTIAPRPAAWTIGALLIFVGAGLLSQRKHFRRTALGQNTLATSQSSDAGFEFASSP